MLLKVSKVSLNSKSSENEILSTDSGGKLNNARPELEEVSESRFFGAGSCETEKGRTRPAALGGAKGGGQRGGDG